MVLAVGSCHKFGFIHRNLKLDVRSVRAELIKVGCAGGLSCLLSLLTQMLGTSFLPWN
jgi:hypothetical protein